MDKEELELWTEYKENYNLEARDALIEKYLDYCYSIGLKIYRKYSDFIKMDNEEIFGITSFALIKIIENFDHKKNIPFIKFLNKVITWYIKDELSKYMNVSIRDQMRVLKKISKGGNKEILKFAVALSFRNMTFMAQMYGSQDFSKSDDLGVHEKTETEEFLGLISQAIDNVLNDNEREVLRKMYYENKKLAQISDEMKLTKQRINQLHRSGLEKIKNFLNKKVFK
ncbi:MAG: sigma-70 family RNA polymerase sigma factor [bacterium]